MVFCILIMIRLISSTVILLAVKIIAKPVKKVNEKTLGREGEQCKTAPKPAPGQDGFPWAMGRQEANLEPYLDNAVR